MKRYFVLMLAAVIFGATFVPVSAFVSSAGVQITFSQANAGNAPNAEMENCLKNKDKMWIALTVIAGDEQCIDKKGAIQHYLKRILLLISGLVGGIIVLMLTIAGFQYIVSRGDPAAIKAAKDKIQNSLIALILFVCAFAIINYLLPGSIT